MLQISDEAAAILDSQFVVREIDRLGNPHFLIKVPDLQKAPEADFGVEISRDPEGVVQVSLLLYDIPTDPITYEMRFSPQVSGDLRFLHAIIDSAHFRLHPCARLDDRWEVARAQSFRIPANALLRLKHFSLEWPDRSTLASAPPPPASKVAADLSTLTPATERELFPEPPVAAPEAGAETPAETPAPDAPAEAATEAGSLPRRPQADPRDTIIQKLKLQNQTLRSQLREKDKRIIELEDELNEIKSRGRNYRLSGDKKSWWKPF